MRSQEKKSGVTKKNREQLGSIMPELWQEFIMPHLDTQSLVNASLSCRFFNQASSHKLGLLREMLAPRDYSYPFINNPCDTINRLFRSGEEVHHLTLLNSNTFAVVAYKKIHLIQFKQTEEGGYEFTPYSEISVASDGIKTGSPETKLIKLSNTSLIIADDEKACVYDWMTGTRLQDPIIYGVNLLRLTKTPDGYVILTALESKTFQLTHYDLESKALNSFHFSYPGSIHRIDMDKAGNFLVEVHNSNHNHLYCISPEGSFCFIQPFVHDDFYGRMHHLVNHPTLFAFANEFTADTKQHLALYKRNESYSPELLIHLALEGKFDHPVFLQNERFFAWEEESEDYARQLKILDLETKKIIHNSTISSPPDMFNYTLTTEMISLPNGDIIRIEINRFTDKYQISAFCFPPCPKLSENLQSNDICDLEDSMEENSKTKKIYSSCNLF